MLKVEVHTLRSKGPQDKAQQAMNNRINFLEEKLDEEKGVFSYLYFCLNSL